MDIKKTPKNAENFCCKNCDFVCRKKSDWNRHILRPKHLQSINEAKNQEKNAHTCKCGKNYKYYSGLWKHANTCEVVLFNKNMPAEKKIHKPNEHDIIELLINENKDVKNENKDFKNIIMELVKSNAEFQKQIIDVCHKQNNTTISNNNNTTHSNNKTFNLQFFLNEQCKDAMNMSDFVNTFELKLADLESVGDLGYVEGISKIIVERLNSMDIYKRPMHCSDAKRETLYIKDADKWEKEAKHNPKLRKAIQTVSFKNMKLVTTWSDTYPESKNSESRLNDRYMKLIKQSTGGNGDNADNEDKIIRRIAKEIVIEK